MLMFSSCYIVLRHIITAVLLLMRAAQFWASTDEECVKGSSVRDTGRKVWRRHRRDFPTVDSNLIINYY